MLSLEYMLDVRDEHCSGQANCRLLVWLLLGFEWWRRNWLDSV